MSIPSRALRQLTSRTLPCCVLALVASMPLAQVTAWVHTDPEALPLDIAFGANGALHMLAVDAPGASVLAWTPQGQLAWSAPLPWGPGGGFYVSQLAIGPTGNVYAGAYRLGGSPAQFAVAAFDALGTPLWDSLTSFAANGSAILGELLVDAAGRVIATGRAPVPATSTSALSVLVLEADGAPAWSAQYLPVSSSVGWKSAVLDGAGGVILLGQRDSGPGKGGSLGLVHFADGGAIDWEAAYPSPAPPPNINYLPVALRRDAAGRSYALAQRPGAGGASIALVAFRADGSFLWERIYAHSASSSDEAFDLRVNVDGNATIVGTTRVPPAPNDFLVLRYSSAGELLWARTYDGSHGLEDRARGIELAPQGRAIVTGVSVVASASTAELSTIAYDEQGEELWLRRLVHPPLGVTDQCGIDVDGNGAVAVAVLAPQLLIGEELAVARYEPMGFESHGLGSAGSGGIVPLLSGLGSPGTGSSCKVVLTNGLGGAAAVIGWGAGPQAHLVLNAFGGTLYVLPAQSILQTLLGAAGVPGAGRGSLPISIPLDAAIVGLELRFQAGVIDAGASEGVALSNALEMWIG